MKQGVGMDLPKPERARLLAVARGLLQRGASYQDVAAATGLRPDYISTISSRLRRGITGGKRKP